MRALLPLFLISAAAVGVEIALTRIFAVGSWSEYGYWVISIAMTGFAVSGVVMVLGRARFRAWAGWMLPALPLAMLLAGALGWIGVAANPFNPLELQNPATAGAQLWNILGYYGALFPFFFLAGLAVSLNFVVHAGQVGRVYGYDLLGAGAGAALALGLLCGLHPFWMIPALLPLLALAAGLSGRGGWRWAAVAVLLGGEAMALLLAAPKISEYKAIYAPLHVPDGQQRAEVLAPLGVYQLLDNFTERLDTDVSNNAGMMGLPAPPRGYGLYRDGARIATLPMGPPESAHAAAALDAAPYALLAAPRVLVLGGEGGFRAAEALALGAAAVTVIEPEPVLHAALANGLGPSPAPPADPRVTLSDQHPLAPAEGYDLIDISGDFLAAREQNRHAYTAEAMAAWLATLPPGGMISIPITIRELPAYALRLAATAVAALRQAGVAEPAAHLAVLRSAWNLRLLIARDAIPPETVARLAEFAETRSFDLSYAPGYTAPSVWNDMPAVSLESEMVQSGGEAVDSIAQDIRALLAGTAAPSAFDRSPITADRPWLSPIVRFGALPLALARIEVLPQSEIGLLVNAAVLAQAAVLALIVMLLPLVARGALRVPARIMGRALVYFPALGLGFLMIEIVAIEQAALLLGDRTAGFSLVLTTMLVFSGAGAMLAGRVTRPDRALGFAVLVVVLCCALGVVALHPAVLAGLGLGWWARAGLLVVALAPLSFALGLPFPLGLDRFQRESPAMLPWAWSLNGAFSVLATPLANLLGHGFGLVPVLVAGMFCYFLAGVLWPRSPA